VGRICGLPSSEIGIPGGSDLTVASLGGSSGVLDRGDPPATPPEEKIRMFRSVNEVWRIDNIS